jgi:cell wall-associated NlpC family hydrolase
VFRVKIMNRFIVHLLCIVSIMLCNSAAANFSTQNAKVVLITFLEAVKSSISDEVLSQAMCLKGIKYKYGGNSPQTGFDCSDFVGYVFNKAANVKLPRTTRGLSRIGGTVKKQEVLPGDLVFFNTRRRASSHVGIYLGVGEFIHAPRTGSKVRVENMDTGYWKQRFNVGKRMKETNED